MKKSHWIGISILIIAIIIVFGIYYWIQPNNTAIDEELDDYQKPEALKEFNEQYDVIVIGGEPEGVAAAVSAARNGAKTLLVEHREELGGLFTYGMLNFLDIPQGEDGNSVSEGVFEEWHQMVGGGNVFGIQEAKVAFKKLVDEEENLRLSAETDVIESVVDQNKATAVSLQNKHGEFTVNGKRFIDATQDADFAVMSGAPYFVGGEDIGLADKKMAVTLMIHLNDVNWEKVRETAASEKFGYAEVTDQAAWGFSDLHYDYEPVEENTRLRGLNLAKINNDYYINALQIFGIDGLDEESKKEAIEKGKRETEHILDFLQAEFPGFEEAKIASFPSELYVRETRHIEAEYQLPMSDVWTNKDHWDGIGFGAYPVDVQAQTPNDYGYVVSDPKQYAIPFRSLIPKSVDGLLVTGRSTGYSSLAAGSARVVPTGMVTGEAAGAAAAIGIEEDISFRDMSADESLIDQLRERLAEQGAFVEPLETDYPYQGEWYDVSIQTLIDYGLVVGGYTNDLRVDEEATTHSFINMIKGAILRSNPDLYNQIGDRLNRIHADIYNQEDELLNREQAADILVNVLFEESKSNSWQALLDEGIMENEIADKIPEEETLTQKEIYAISASLIENQ
ncbi:FAD-dependent oxidoreductase [Oceanobacillus halotolerans]|uniref:FAD-dependent oxidoreductase n=1 Tax=Oceanobacillus halotolerans TaxID=2663380 RepID=UPI0013DBE49C|nr:FAD-dependent oxidoreductase [Oceanobacillus halotolerans]